MLDFIDLEFILQLIAFIGEETSKQDMPALVGLIALSLMLVAIAIWIQPPPRKKNPFERKEKEEEEKKDKAKLELKEPTNLEQKLKESNSRRLF